MSGSTVTVAAAAAGALWACSSAFVTPSAGTSKLTAGLRGAANNAAAPAPEVGALPCLAAGAAAVLLAGAGTSRRRAVTSSTSSRAFENEMGVTMPMKYFDPLGMSSDGDEATFRRRREAEIKNGRVAMWACMGWIVPEYFRWPGFCSPSQDIKFSDIPNGIAALGKVPVEGWAQIGIFIAFIELFPGRQEKDRIPGDLPGFGRLGLPVFARKCDVEGSRRGLDAELNNGRLAMIAITGMMTQSLYFSKTTGPEMWLPGASAFEGELGVQAPVGFWDPLGLSADGDAEAFRRRRGVELKHGRICMLASVGYIIPEYFRWPGYLSPEQGIKFSDVPHGIAAVSKVPIEGWLQIGLFIGHYEGKFFKQERDRAPGDFEGYGFLGIGKNFVLNFEPVTFSDPEVRKQKLAAEIANGRLAMVALSAMVFQNGTVGTTGPEMWLP